MIKGREQKTMSENAKSETNIKIELVLEEFKNNPTQSISSLCKKHNLSKSQLYVHLRKNGITLDEIRKERGAPLTKRAQVGSRKTRGVPSATPEYMREVVDKIDELRAQGLSPRDAMPKTKFGLHFRTYYTYRDKIKELDKKELVKNLIKPKAQVGKKETRPYHKKQVLSSVPAHTIEYIKVDKETDKKPETKNTTTKDKELVMMIGSPDMLYDFIKKMRGTKDE
jgi:ACT domain-containing protein